MSPKTRPKVPASVASNPDHIKGNGGNVRNIKGGKERVLGTKRGMEGMVGHVIQQVELMLQSRFR